MCHKIFSSHPRGYFGRLHLPKLNNSTHDLAHSHVARRLSTTLWYRLWPQNKKIYDGVLVRCWWVRKRKFGRFGRRDSLTWCPRWRVSFSMVIGTKEQSLVIGTKEQSLVKVLRHHANTHGGSNHGSRGRFVLKKGQDILIITIYIQGNSKVLYTWHTYTYHYEEKWIIKMITCIIQNGHLGKLWINTLIKIWPVTLLHTSGSEIQPSPGNISVGQLPQDRWRLEPNSPCQGAEFKWLTLMTTF